MVERIRQVYTKWGDHPHWEFDCDLVGSDAHGSWLFLPAGTSCRRPGASFVAPVDSVTLVSPELSWTATFHAWWDAAPTTTFGSTGDLADGPLRFSIYADIATPAVWRGGLVTMVDLDLDVVRRLDGSVQVLDEDEFDEHRVAYDYPDDLVATARDACEHVVAAMAGDAEPFATVGWAWLARAQRR